MRSRHKMKKRESEYLHFQRRLRERYGLLLNQQSNRELIRHIKTGTAQIIRIQSNRVRLFSIPIRVSPELQRLNSDKPLAPEMAIVVVYDNIHHQLVTCGDILNKYPEVDEG